MRRRSSIDSLSGDSEYANEDDGTESDEMDLRDAGIYSDEDELCEGTEDESWLYDGDHPPEHYIRQLETFDEREYTKQDYADGSTRQLNHMEGQWNQCWTYLRRDDLRNFATISVGTLYTFFDWLLKQRRGKGGRRRRGTKIASSLGTYWKVFRLVYERATGMKLNGKVNRNMHTALRKLAKTHGLKEIGQDKACMYVEDQTLVLQTNLVTTEKRYPHGRYRIQAQLFLQLGGFTANRPQALLSLCYRHIKVTLLRDPEGGPHRVLLEFTFEFTKQFLGIKDMNTFPLPEIMYDESLIFSPHVFLLGLLFYDKAFAPHNLTSQEELSKLNIPPGQNQLPLPLHRRLDDIPVFRKAEKTPTGWVISRTEPLPYSTLQPWIRALGEITGFAQVTRPYSLRYSAGKAFNENGNVSEAMQNLIMGHASITTFVKHYLSRQVSVDTQAVTRGIQPQDALMRAACTMSRSIDPRRPRRLTPEQSASVNDLPTVRLLLDQRKQLKRTLKNATQHPKYQKLNRRIIQERQYQRHILLKDVKKRWEYEQPVRDVEHQLASVELKDDPASNNDIAAGLSALLPAQRELADAILSHPGLNLDEEIRRRNRGICAVTRYCGIEEGGARPCGLKRSSVHVTPLVKSKEDPQLEIDRKALESAKVSVYKDKRPTICFVCLSNKNLPTEQRIASFHSPGDLTRHFKRRHLQYVKEGDQFSCDLCQVHLEGGMHLQRHALDIHGTVS